MRHGGKPVERLGTGDFCGEEGLVGSGSRLFDFSAEVPSIGYLIPAALVEDKPVLLWRLREAYDRRVAEIKAVFEFVWRKEYETGLGDIDEQHRGIFEAIERLRPERRGGGLEAGLEELRRTATAHFEYEQERLAAVGYPELKSQAREHERIIAGMEAHGGGLGEDELADFLKDYLLKHTLTLDRRYIRWLAGSEGKDQPGRAEGEDPGPEA
jgi:hemerythrin-like metal-binding protein